MTFSASIIPFPPDFDEEHTGVGGNDSYQGVVAIPVVVGLNLVTGMVVENEPGVKQGTILCGVDAHEDVVVLLGIEPVEIDVVIWIDEGVDSVAIGDFCRRLHSVIGLVDVHGRGYEFDSGHAHAAFETGFPDLVHVHPGVGLFLGLDVDCKGNRGDREREQNCEYCNCENPFHGLFLPVGGFGAV